MNKIALDRKQADELIELGLDPNTADGYVTEDGAFATFPILDSNGQDISHRSWSLAGLLEQMPSIELEKFGAVYSLEGFDHFTDDYLNSVDATFEMCSYLLKRGLMDKANG